MGGQRFLYSFFYKEKLKFSGITKTSEKKHKICSVLDGWCTRNYHKQPEVDKNSEYTWSYNQSIEVDQPHKTIEEDLNC